MPRNSDIPLPKRRTRGLEISEKTRYTRVVSKDRAGKQSGRQETMFNREDFPVRVGCQQGKSSVAYILGYHAELEYHLIIQGKGSYFIHGEKYEFAKNSVLLIHKNEVHNYLPHPDSFIKKIFLIFSPEVFDEGTVVHDILERLRSFHYLVLSAKECSTAELLLEEIAEECRLKDIHWREMVSNDVERFLLILDRAKERSPQTGPRHHPVVKKVIDYLEEHFAEKVLLEDVSKMFGVSQYHLSRVFKEYTGMGYKEYIIHRRIAEAKRLLVETDLKVASIAYRVGFYGVSIFSRDFKEITGATPATYRKLST